MIETEWPEGARLTEEERRRLIDWYNYGPATPEDREYIDKAVALYKMMGHLHAPWHLPHYNDDPTPAYMFVIKFRIYRYKNAKNMYEGVKRAMDKRMLA